MTLYGPSLEILKAEFGKPFSPGTMLRVAIETLRKIEELHKRDFVFHIFLLSSLG
jgi:hypothetical protein